MAQASTYKDRLLKALTNRYVILMVVGAIVFLIIFNPIKKILAGNAGGQELLDETQSEITQLEQQGQQPSYSDNTYKSLANTAHESMNYSVWSDSPSSLVNVMKQLNNDLDYRKLRQAYGLRQLHYFGLPDGPKKDLDTAVRTDMPNTAEDINEIFEKKGIEFRF